MANLIWGNLDKKSFAELIAIYIVMKAKGGNSEASMNYYIKNHLLNWLKKLFTSLDDFVSDLEVDVKFMEIMLKLVGKRLNLEDII